MRFMNRWEIEDARARWARHPVLGPATATLVNLRDAADRNSDGWAYWPKPVRAAEKLMDLIEGRFDTERRDRFDTERADATVEKLRAALRPIKAFRTRSGINFEIVEELTEAKPTREAALILQDLAALIANELEDDRYPPGSVEALDIAIRALDPNESEGYPVEIGDLT